MTRETSPFDLVSRESFDQDELFAQGGSVPALLARIANAYGMRNVAYLAVNLPSREDRSPYIATTYPDQWVMQYRDRKYHLHDPVIRRGFDSLMPIDWCQFDRSEPRVRRLFGEANEFNIGRHGLSFPIRGRHGERAIFSVTMDATDKAWLNIRRHLVREFQIIAHQTHRLVLSTETIAPSPVKLSQREIDCLTWASMGKTQSEIAMILDIGERTVLYYLICARGKLNATNTTHAVAKAISMNIIAPGM